MIDYERTKELLGNVGPLRFNPKVVKRCDSCNQEAIVNYKGKQGKPCSQYYCKKCAIRKPGVLEKVTEATKRNWVKNEKFREAALKSLDDNRNTPGFQEKAHNSPLYRAAILKHNQREYSKETKQKLSNSSTELWKLEEYRNNMIKNIVKFKPSLEHCQSNSRAMLKHWANKDSIFNTKVRRILIQSRLSMPSCSSIQETLYSILEDLNIKFFREYKDKEPDLENVIGYYKFDCVIPRTNKPTLLIECQGDYWHSLPKIILNDARKATYIANNLSDRYEIKYLWEHEFQCKDKIVTTIKHWLNIDQTTLIDYSFKDVIIKPCKASEYKLLLSKYHYLPNAGRGGIAYGAYLDDTLIGVCVFSPLIRQNINIPGYKQEEVRELSRLCIHPSYQKPNLASWFISRCIKQLDIKYKYIISYCDTTFNHDGATYKACNFKHDSTIKPDYWYVDQLKFVMHKKTLYNHAIKNNLTESEFALKYGYTKVYGKDKLRFVYER